MVALSAPHRILEREALVKKPVLKYAVSFGQEKQV